jgi:hypothetical protein
MDTREKYKGDKTKNNSKMAKFLPFYTNVVVNDIIAYIYQIKTSSSA